VGVILHDGLKRMVEKQENVFYYLTLLNENYPMPGLIPGTEEQIIKGMYLCKPGDAGKLRVQLLGSGTILREVIAGADLLAEDWGVTADIWSAPSFNELRREGLRTERWNRLHPAQEPRRSYVETCLAGQTGPVIAATDYIKAYADQIRPFVPGRYTVLGTDGFGRSDYRRALRSFFEVDRHHVAVAALYSLAQEGAVPAGKVADAIKKYGIDPEKPDPSLS
jgi:pyruvate dehydrogenase E1 component